MVKQICKNKNRICFDINSKIIIINNVSKNNAIVPINNTQALISKRLAGTLKRLNVANYVKFQPKVSKKVDITMFTMSNV